MDTLQSFGRVSGGELIGGDTAFNGLSIDTRTLASGELFLALPGTRADGHEFVRRAACLGAAGAVVARRLETNLPQVVVPDVAAALARYAWSWRRRFDMPVFAVTGSNGKTTVKQMLAAILAAQGPVLSTQGNLNNHLGVPLSLARLRKDHRAAVLELGANHPGEIARLTYITAPTAGVITMAGPAHLEGFGSIAGVARAKGELYQGMRPGSLAIINADDDFAGLWVEMADHCRRLHYGREGSPDVTAAPDSVALGAGETRFELVTPDWRAQVRLPLPGEHNIANALAAAACAFGAGVAKAHIVAGLAAVESIPGRLTWRRGVCGARILDDSYNANPASLRAALNLATAGSAPCWLVLGDMGELGSRTQTLHAKAGEMAREAGVQRLYALGEASRAAVAAFGEGACHFDNHAHLARALSAEIEGGEVILVKGSRSQHLERVVERLADAPAGTAARAANGG